MGFYSESDFEPERSIGYLVRRIHQLGLAGLEPLFAEEGMNYTQWSALMSIWCRRGETAADIARDLGHDKGAMTRLIDQLEERGWIARERTATDRRCINLTLTDAGNDVAIRCKRRVAVCYNEWLSGWSDAEVEGLIAMLQRLRGTMAAVEAPCA